MTEKELWIQAIRANPDDDELRLVFADWLEERGDPRGEFIQLQMNAEATDSHTPTYAQIQDRIQKLLIHHRKKWVKEDTGVDHDPGFLLDQALPIFYIFRKGFVAGLEIHASDNCPYPEELTMRELSELELNIAGTLTLIFLDFSCPSAIIARGLEKVQTEWTHRVQTLHLHLTNPFSASEMIRLLSSPVTKNVSELVIPATGPALFPLAEFLNSSLSLKKLVVLGKNHYGYYNQNQLEKIISSAKPHQSIYLPISCEPKWYKLPESKNIHRHSVDLPRS